VKPATRLATAILAYSFGGLRREGKAEEETLPPGVTESELLAACVSPDFDNITATAVLSELRSTCLYLHYDGVRYCFKKDPNVTKLIEDAEQEVARNPEDVRERIRELLNKRLAGHRGAVVWPKKSQDIPDEEPRFLVGYLPLEFAAETKPDQENQAIEMLSKYGDRPRRYRNGIGLAIPEKKQIETLRRAVRYLLAIERVEDKKRQLRLSKDQLDQLKERRHTEEAAAESAFRGLYTSVWLPRVEEGGLGMERVEVGGRPLQSTGVHERIMELLTSVGTPRIHGTVTPRKIAERVKLGESVAEGERPLVGIKTSDVLEAFYRDIKPPRLDTDLALRKGIARGIDEGVFSYTSGAFPSLGPDGKFQISRDRIVMGRAIAEDEVDLESGYLMVKSAIPEPMVRDKAGESESGIPPEGMEGTEKDRIKAGLGGKEFKRTIKLLFKATRDQIFKAFPAIANLADKSDDGRVTVRIEGSSAEGYEPSWLRNAVEEPLDEADIEQQMEAE